MAFIDRTGEKHFRISILSYAGQNKFGKSVWNCLCDCGNTLIVTATAVRNGTTPSCGCKRKEAAHAIRHGDHKNKLYKVWTGMRQRCSNPNNKAYKNYGERGIKVCVEWEDYITFRTWSLNNGYIKGLTLDRTDNEKGYAPHNCKWISQRDQMYNTRRNIRVEIGNCLHKINEASILTGIPEIILRNRARNGWTGDKLIQDYVPKK